MKYIDEKDIEELPHQKLGADEAFSFRCHPGIACFNRCCRNLNLFLYPYDVIRLKNQLGITSDEFLDQYVDVVLRDASFFPEVLLHMSENEERTCPFLSESGCTVYPDRPDTCRTFPVEQGVLYDALKNRTKVVHFFRPPEFCLGQHQEKQWTTRTWAQDQEAEVYHKMTVQWSKLKRLFQNDPWGSEGPNGPKGKMAFMATYNVDRFRAFVFNSSFLKRYKVKSATLKKIRADESELMLLGFDWVKLILWGMKTKNIRLRR
jgi:Fe-S-cluster containining protein